MPKIEYSSYDNYFKDFKLHMMLYSFNGVGKTTLAGRTGLRTVLLDCGDSGVVTLRGVPKLKIVKVKNIAHYLDVMDDLNARSDNVDLLIPDTITGLQALAIKEVKGRRGEMNQRKWGQVSSKVIECLSETRAFSKDVLYLAQEKRRTIDEGGGDITFIAPSLTPSIREYLSGSIDWIGRMYLEDGSRRKLTFILSNSLEVKDRADPPVFPKVLTLPPVNGSVYPAYSAIRQKIVNTIKGEQ